MDIFSVLTMVGGLALFLYGMQVMGDGLAKVSGGKLERILENLTSNPIKAVLLGAGVTAVIQSSSATTVMVVGLVNSGIMKLNQAVGIIMGANIGTTVTSWILSLSGLQGDNVFVKLCKPSSFSPLLAVIGVIFLLFIKDEKKKDIGAIMVGFAGLMLGQHVYVEADYGQSEEKAGIWLDESFICDADTDSPYVWVDDGKGKLEKRSVTLGQHDDELFQYEIADGLSKDDMITYPEDGLKEGMKTAVGSNGQMGQSNPVTDGDDMDLSNEDYSEKDGSGSDLSDENVDGVDSGETNQEDLTEDGMQQNESNADGSEDVIGGTEDAQ